MNRRYGRVSLSCHLGRFRLPIAAAIALLCVAGIVSGGCSSPPKAAPAGFLSDYSNLKAVSETRVRYIAPEVTQYTSFIVDPVQLTSQQGDLKPEDRAEIVRYFAESLVNTLGKRGYRVALKPQAGTARIRIALTRVQELTWWVETHPGASLPGAGQETAMEFEIVDSTTGHQVAAVVQVGVGGQFPPANFGTVEDIKSDIDQWVESAVDRLDELRGVPK